ncbi:MAG: 4Fe-4S dicluster domain-containing protein [Acidobacteria bacterium]|nr:4Fe-4S dicluster domain-containing protein [Acidobacteriota bacterium]
MNDKVDNPDRKAFFRESLRLLKKGLSTQVKRSVMKRLDGPLRPPGALEELEFLATCTRCEACIKACPHLAIQRLPQSAGMAANTPFIQPDHQPCFLCADTPCVTACEPKALVLATGQAIHMGTAVIDEEKCLTYRDKVCTLCYDACPFPEQAITIHKSFHPEVLSGCVGCGLCQYHCPTTPSAVQVLSPVRWQKRQSEQLF